MAELPSREQILAVLRDEPMVSSRLRGALGIPKKSKLAFKQELADMVVEGVLVRNNRKEYLLGEKDSAPEDKEFIDRPAARKNFDDRREGARSRRQRNDDDGASIKRAMTAGLSRKRERTGNILSRTARTLRARKARRSHSAFIRIRASSTRCSLKLKSPRCRAI